jgi:hypothetical protein
MGDQIKRQQEGRGHGGIFSSLWPFDTKSLARADFATIPHWFCWTSIHSAPQARARRRDISLTLAMQSHVTELLMVASTFFARRRLRFSKATRYDVAAEGRNEQTTVDRVAE